jgi:hypothetical protein
MFEKNDICLIFAILGWFMYGVWLATLTTLAAIGFNNVRTCLFSGCTMQLFTSVLNGLPAAIIPTWNHPAFYKDTSTSTWKKEEEKSFRLYVAKKILEKSETDNERQGR